MTDEDAELNTRLARSVLGSLVGYVLIDKPKLGGDEARAAWGALDVLTVQAVIRAHKHLPIVAAALQCVPDTFAMELVAAARKLRVDIKIRRLDEQDSPNTETQP